MRTLPFSHLALCALAGCAAASASPLAVPGFATGGRPGSAGATPDSDLTLDADPVAAARARGPSALPALLARYDALPPGRARDAFGLAIDRVAGQRYATVSRLYWYTDLPAAQAVAAAEGKPILALRLLGRLDEDLSCANSRFFRTALYANRELSAYLREHYVLFWSSERPVPRVTIDFGDGRKLERTTTGNSAHYVLDAAGHVLDVLPGLYAPSVFHRELVAAEALATATRAMTDERRAQAVGVEQRRRLEATQLALAKALGTQYVVGGQQLLAEADVQTAMMRAQRVAISKARIEVPDLVQIGMVSTNTAKDDRAGWAAIGQQMFELTAKAGPVRVLDDQSRALVAAIHNGAGTHAPADALAAVIRRFEQSLVADTAVNEVLLRSQIRVRLASTTESFEQLNEFVYAQVFATPASDPWLNLLPRQEFSGLPGDGVVAR